MDARLKRIAADAAARGWDVSWADNPDRTELLVVPTVSNDEQQGSLGFGVAVRLGGRELVFWAWEAWSGSLIEPWLENDDELGIGDESQFPTVTDLESCCRVFDQAAKRFLSNMRRTTLQCFGLGSDITGLADLEPLARQQEAS